MVFVMIISKALITAVRYQPRTVGCHTSAPAVCRKTWINWAVIGLKVPTIAPNEPGWAIGFSLGAGREKPPGI